MPSLATSGLRSLDRRTWPVLALFACTLVFRLPPLLNANGLHSDAAVVGLQAMHMLHGEFSPLLWGTGYQGSFDAAVLAVAFWLFGPSGFVLMAVPLLGHVLLTLLVFLTLSRHLDRWAAFVIALPVVFTPQAIHAVALYPPRQWSITCLFAAVWLLDRGQGRRPQFRLALGAVCVVLALYMDLFVMQLMPAMLLFALLCALDAGDWPQRAKRASAVCAGVLAGAVILLFLRGDPFSDQPTGLVFRLFDRNVQLLWDVCLPWLLGYGVYIPGAALYPDLWTPPAAVRYVQMAAAFSFLMLVASAGVYFFVRRLAWPVRRLGALGLLAVVSSIGAFLVSGMPGDMWSTRYLAPVIWFAPFALAPLASMLRRRWLAAALMPYLIVAAVGGWLSYGPYVAGGWPVRTARGTAVEEAELGRFLRARGIRYGAAQYWLSYRLTFLFREDPIIVPMNHNQERYPPYLEGFRAAPAVAYVFHPSEPRATLGAVQPAILPQGGAFEIHEIAGFTVLLHYRQSPPGRTESPPGAAR